MRHQLPAYEVSGDFYDFFELGTDDYFSLGDVSGKGMDAALLMSKTASLFRCAGKTRMTRRTAGDHQQGTVRDGDTRHVRHHGLRHPDTTTGRCDPMRA
jgi:hypothetical protein